MLTPRDPLPYVVVIGDHIFRLENGWRRHRLKAEMFIDLIPNPITYINAMLRVINARHRLDLKLESTQSKPNDSCAAVPDNRQWFVFNRKKKWGGYPTNQLAALAEHVREGQLQDWIAFGQPVQKPILQTEAACNG